MATTSTTAFLGNSQFATDFQNVISRATAIASLPITQMTADQTALTSQSTALTGLDTTFKALQTAVQGIADSLGGSAFRADVSDPTKVSVNLSTGAAEGNYTIDVVDPGAYATSITSGTWNASADATRTYQLSLGGVNYAITPADNTEASVVAAINAQQGDKVHATMVNVGTNTNADYRISLQAIKLGDLQPGLIVGPSTPASLQAQQTHGSSTLATSQTSQTWDDNPALAYKLSIGGATYDITFTDTSAQGIASAINSQYGDKVTAAAVDVSTNGTRDYRITLTAAKPGNAEPDLLVTDGIADPASIQTQKAAGSDTKATSRTAATWTGAPGSYQLSLGGVKYALTVADNSIDSVVSAINTQYGSKVTAAKVDLGTGTTHDYRISLTAVNAGDLQPDLVESAANVQKQTATGALANYVVNNSALPVTSDTRSVTIATGITLTLLAKDNGTPVNITVTRPTSAVSDALSAFANAYNNTVDEVDKQHGTTAGPLAGQSILGQLSRILSGIGTYSSSTTGSVGGLSDLGLILDKTGHMTFNSLTLMAADISNSADVTAFLGSTTSGFLKQATDGMTGVEDSVSGLLPTMEADLKTQISGVAAAIADQQTKVDDMTLRMQTQMAAADALISSMEQQYNYIAGMFQAMDTASNQYK